jgi:hypothetical protein
MSEGLKFLIEEEIIEMKFFYLEMMQIKKAKTKLSFTAKM